MLRLIWVFVGCTGHFVGFVNLLHILHYVFQSVEVGQPVDAFIDMAVSFNNKYIALFTESGMVWIGSADLTVS